MTEASTPPLAVPGVDFVTVPTQDLDASMHFYGTILGLPFVKRWGDRPAVEYQAGNLTITVMDPTAFGQEFRPHSLPIALQVQDVAAARAALEAQGVTFVSEVIDSGVCNKEIFFEPAGNALVLHNTYVPIPNQ